MREDHLKMECLLVNMLTEEQTEQDCNKERCVSVCVIIIETTQI